MIREISPRDQMHCAGTPFADEHYFHVGASSLRCIDVALHSAGIERIDIRRVLDMPCGHGRVMRYIRAEFPHAEITACDLDRDGVDFCAKTFGAHRLYSQEDIKSIAVPGPGFDLIWVGSLFTHLQYERWREFLTFFRRSISDTGLLVFSTHGREAVHYARQKIVDYGIPAIALESSLSGFDAAGFGYGDYPDAQSYGVSFARPDWVFSQVADAGFQIVHFGERAWDDHQDIYACVQPASRRSRHSISDSASPLQSSVSELRMQIL